MAPYKNVTLSKSSTIRCKLSKRQSHLDSTELEELETTLASVRSNPDKDKCRSDGLGKVATPDCCTKRCNPMGPEDTDQEAADLKTEEIFMFESEDSAASDRQQGTV